VDAEEPIITPPARSSDAILWILVLITVSAAAVGGIFLSRQLFKSPAQVASAPQAPNLRKGIPVVNSELAGKAITLPDAEVPLKTGGQPATIIVRIKVDKSGRVYSAMTSSGDRVLREAAVDAAKRSTFAVTKLGNRSVEGAITYTFN
jgi:TonB family protein